MGKTLGAIAMVATFLETIVDFTLAFRESSKKDVPLDTFLETWVSKYSDPVQEGQTLSQDIDTLRSVTTQDEDDLNEDETQQAASTPGLNEQYAIPGLEGARSNEVEAIRKQYTNPDGTMKKGWLKAPNGKPTNLTEDQWLHVRTPAFKKWFGDWESAFIANQLLTMDALRVVLHTPIDKKGIKEAFVSFGEVENAETHRRVLFPASSAGKIHYHKGFKTNSIIRSFKQLFESSILAISEEKDGHQEHPNFTGYEHYINKFTIDGKGTYFIRFTVPLVRNNKGADYVHSSAISRVDIYTEKEASSLDTDKNFGQLDTSFIDNKIAKFFASRNNASKVVDENGEPRVVYHGSHWEPSKEPRGKAVFDIDRVGSNFEEVEIDYNFFFTASQSSAQGYGKVTPVFLNIRKPSLLKTRYEIPDYVHAFSCFMVQFVNLLAQFLIEER